MPTICNIHMAGIMPIEGLNLCCMGDLNSFRDVDQCPVCDDVFETAVKVEADGFKSFLSRGYCTKCGYFGTKRGFSADWLKAYYNKNWTQRADVQEAELKSTFCNFSGIEFFKEYLPDHNSKILDAGAGYGSSVRAFLERGFKNVEALELSKRRADVLKQKYNIPVDTCAISEVSSSNILSKKYNLIYMWHVFEHIPELHSTIETISNLLLDDGLLFIAVPDFDEEHTLMLSHLYSHEHSFQISTLTYLLQIKGFDLLKVEGCKDGRGNLFLFRKSKLRTNQNEVGPIESRVYYTKKINEKLMKDFHLPFLFFQKKALSRPVILGFHCNSAFFGSTLIRYPLRKIDEILYRSLMQFKRKKILSGGFFNKLFNKLFYHLSSYLELPPYSILINKIEEIAIESDAFQEVYDGRKLLSVKLIHRDSSFYIWQE